jgi:hypothetical protein
MAIKYKSKGGAIQYKPPFSWIQDVMIHDNTDGFCLACAANQSGVEPDVGKIECESCGARKVYGAELLLTMGLYYYDNGGSREGD